MPGKFYAVGSFFIKSKNLFVVVGNVLQGTYQPGDRACLDLGNLSVGTMVSDTEVVEVTYSGKEYLGLAFAFDDPEDLEFWRAMNISDETLDLIDEGNWSGD